MILILALTLIVLEVIIALQSSVESLKSADVSGITTQLNQIQERISVQGKDMDAMRSDLIQARHMESTWAQKYQDLLTGNVSENAQVQALEKTHKESIAVVKLQAHARGKQGRTLAKTKQEEIKSQKGQAIEQKMRDKEEARLRMVTAMSGTAEAERQRQLNSPLGMRFRSVVNRFILNQDDLQEALMDKIAMMRATAWANKLM